LFYLPVDEKNIAYKAAKLLMDEFQIKEGVHITLDKHIPVAAGMAGGSSNAAAVLVGMNRLFRLGLSEQDILDLVEKHIKIIIEMEEKARKTLLSVNESVIMDMCYRAYGVLTNSYVLSTKECIELLSKLRFGVVLNLYKFKNASIIDELYTSVQPAHLMDYYNLELSLKEQDIFRAKFVSESLENKLIKGVR
jgi:protein-arginine kinase